MCKRHVIIGSLAVALLCPATAVAAEPRAYRLPDVDIKQQVIWGSTCPGPNGTGLAFGGQDQKSEDGRPHTRVMKDGRWTAIHRELRAANPLQTYHARARVLRNLQRRATARARYIFFKGLSAEEESRLVKSELVPLQRDVGEKLSALIDELTKTAAELENYEAGQAKRAVACLQSAQRKMTSINESLAAHVYPETIQEMSALTIELDKVCETLDAQPPPRALSPLVYDPKTKLFVLFGGDHCDYLTNDTWVFDPTRRKWFQRRPPAAPPPRANHVLTADGNGKIKMTGGYTYTSLTWYCAGQYRDLDDGPWTYDVAKNEWTGSDKLVPADARVYRTGPFHPDFFLQGPKPNAAVNEKRLNELPANTWVAMAPPHLPRLNRDWGTAVIDPDHDVILRFSGGHSAHGGSDVLHYHLSTNRWELPFPVEFPLGQLYANTRYPNGYNFNLRPWVTGHTYQNYGYEPRSQKMLFTGRPNHCYVYDPVAADWTGRGEKPAAMKYNSCFYTITLCRTPRGLFAWTRNGDVLLYDAAKREWVGWELTGVELPGAVVDNSTLAYDAKRDRLLFFVKRYGRDHAYDGQIYSLDLATRRVATLSPESMASAAAIPYLCQIRYDADNDLMLVGATLPPDSAEERRTPAFDCTKNRWVSLRITGDDPSGEKGRNVSLGLMYDAQRKRFWAVDTNSRVFVLRLDPGTADVKPLP